MATVQYQASGTTDTQNRRSPANWFTCPWQEMGFDANYGYRIWDDFLLGPSVAAGQSNVLHGNWMAFTSAGTTIADDAAAVGGIMKFDADTHDDAAVLASPSCPFQISSSNKSLWFEARVKASSIADGQPAWFIGLMGSTTITATVPCADAAIGDANLIGFYRTEADGDKFDTLYKTDGNAAVNVKADAVTLVADTWIKVGFFFDAVACTVTFFQNGLALDDIVTKTVVTTGTGNPFPNDARLRPVCGCQMPAGAAGEVYIDWIAVAQAR